MKKIYYWCPFIDKVATVKAVINSCEGLQKYTKNKIPYIIDAAGEFDGLEKSLRNKNISLIKLSKYSYINKLPKYGFIKSRLTYIIIFLFSFNKLRKLLINEKPDYFIVHLITSLPIILFMFFNFKTKLILRISGLPKLNIFRRIFWKLNKNRIYLITSPTNETRKHLINQKIFNADKIITLKDPIVNIREINIKKKEIIDDKTINKSKYFLSIGRLTEQKNFKLLINAFAIFTKSHNNINLIIIGTGEQNDYLSRLVKKLNIDNRVHLIGYKNNVFKYLNNAHGFILSSKWEDPGFVIVEAAACRTPIISSDCKNGPQELLENGRCGTLFKNNDLKDLVEKLNLFEKFDSSKKKIMALEALKNAKEFGIFSHSRKLNLLLK
tara:strand:+ start:5 stop:1150 length:1146 start_codon:yes stop_codon:yes gene_type:complete